MWDGLIISPQDDLELLCNPKRWRGRFVCLKRYCLYGNTKPEFAVFYLAADNKTYLLHAGINEVAEQHKKGILRSEYMTADQAINEGWLVD